MKIFVIIMTYGIPELLCDKSLICVWFMQTYIHVHVLSLNFLEKGGKDGKDKKGDKDKDKKGESEFPWILLTTC